MNFIPRIEIVRYSGPYKGEYWIYTEAEANKLELEYNHWEDGLDDSIHFAGKYILVDPYESPGGKLILPSMVIPIIYADNHPERSKHKRVAYKNCDAIIQLPTKCWFMYQDEDDGSWRPKMTSAWNKHGVYTSIEELRYGVQRKHISFVIRYLHYALNENIEPFKAAELSYIEMKKEFEGFQQVRKNRLGTVEQRAVRLLFTMLGQIGAGMMSQPELEMALNAAGVDPEWIVNNYKRLAEMDTSTALAASDRLAFLSGIQVRPPTGGVDKQDMPPSLPTGETSGGPRRALPGYDEELPMPENEEPEKAEYQEEDDEDEDDESNALPSGGGFGL